MTTTISNYEWLAVEVVGTAENLTSKLNELEQQGYDIFAVTGLLFPNAHGWVVVGHQRAGVLPAAQAPAATSQREPEPRKGTVALHKAHKG